MPYQMFLRIMDPQQVASVRVTTESEDIGPLAGEHLPSIWEYLRSLNMQPGGAPFIRYHQIDEPPYDLEFGFPVVEPVAPHERIAMSELPGGTLAVTWHVGPYETAVHASGALRKYIQEQGWREAGPHWDVYWTNPQLEPNQARWKTEVLWPVRLDAVDAPDDTA